MLDVSLLVCQSLLPDLYYQQTCWVGELYPFIQVIDEDFEEG